VNSLILFSVGAALVYAIARYVLKISSDLGAVASEKDRLKKDMELAKKRADAMAEDKTRDQTISDLNNSKF
jgi:hypothetical protein